MLNKSTIKYLTLFLSVLAFAVGCILIFMPLGSNVVVNYILVISLGVIGVAKICKFASEKDRVVWDLVLGLLFLIACLILLANGALIVEVTAGYILAALALISGIRHFFLAPDSKKLMGISGGWLVLMGIVEIVLAGFLVIFPIMSQAVFFYVYGIFLVVYAIITFIQGLLIKIDRRKKR